MQLVESRGDTWNAQTKNSRVREKVNLEHSFLSTFVPSDSEYISIAYIFVKISF
jgi:hypothetical protein